MINWTEIIVTAIITTPSWLAWFEAHLGRTKIEETHELVNGQSHELKRAIAIASELKGVAVGVAIERANPMEPKKEQ